MGHHRNRPVVKLVDEETGEERWVCADCLQELLEKGEVQDRQATKRTIGKLRKLEKLRGERWAM